MITEYGIAAALFLLALAGMTLEKAYFYLPARELARRAAKGDHIAAAFTRVTEFGDELRLLLAGATWLSAAIGIVLLVRLAPLVASVLGTILVLVLVFFWQSRAPLTATGARFAALCARPLHWLLTRLHPVLRRPAALFARYHLHRSHTGLYEQADVVELLERQRHQRDNRIDVAELERLQRVLAAHKATVRELMTPRDRVTMVKAEEQISPVLINELHQSGNVVFPVYEGKRSNIVGVLQLDAVADVRQHGRVVDTMDPSPVYVHIDDSLERAIRAFYETHRLLFVVVDDHEKYLGVLLASDIFKYLFGPLDTQAFGHFDDAAAVAHKGLGKD